MSADTNLPDTRYIRGVSTTSRGGVSTTSTKPTFAMIPGEVLFDRRMDHRDLRVYAAMVYFRNGEGGEVGSRRLAGASRVDRRTLSKVQGRLVEFGHIERNTNGKARATYRLTATVFSIPSFTDAGVEVNLDPIDLVQCPKCHNHCGGLLKVGWCRRCNWTVRVRDAARQVFHEEVAAEKTA